jgi:hypothetical protein
VGDLVHFSHFQRDAAFGIITRLPPLGSKYATGISKFSATAPIQVHVDSIYYLNSAWKEQQLLHDIKSSSWSEKMWELLRDVDVSPTMLHNLDYLILDMNNKRIYLQHRLRTIHRQLLRERVRRISLNSLGKRILRKDELSPHEISMCYFALCSGVFFIRIPSLSISDPEYAPRSLEDLSRLLTFDHKFYKESLDDEESVFLQKINTKLDPSRIDPIEFSETERDHLLFLRDTTKLNGFTHHFSTVRTLDFIKKTDSELKHSEKPFYTLSFLQSIGMLGYQDPSPVQWSGRSIVPLRGVDAVGDHFAGIEKVCVSHICSDGPFRYSKKEGSRRNRPVPPIFHPWRLQVESYLEPLVDPSARQETHFVDPLVSKRRSLPGPVYVLTEDSRSCGLSVEGEWVQVSIPDPTAYFTPSHPLALFAQLRVQSIHLPHVSFPLFSEKLVNSVLGLRTMGNALTFSAKLDSEGSIVDYNLEPTILEHVQAYSLEDTNPYLDWSPFMETNPPVWTSGHYARARGPILNKMDAADRNQLQSIQQLLLKHRQDRISLGAFFPDSIEPRVSVSDARRLSRGLSSYPEPKDMPATIKVDSDHFPLRSPAHSLMEEASILADRIAARFCLDHHIPSLYASCPSFVDQAFRFCAPDVCHDVEQEFHRVMQTKDSKTGIIHHNEYRMLMTYEPNPIVDTIPRPHSLLGLGTSFPYMVGVSQPLHRFRDLVTHWQLQKFWLEQPFFFDGSSLQNIAQRNNLVVPLVKQLEHNSARFWKIEKFHQDALNAAQSGTSPPTYTAYLSSKKGRVPYYVVPEFSGGSRKLFNSQAKEIEQAVVDKASSISYKISFRSQRQQ